MEKVNLSRPETIEFWENEYLEQIFHLLRIDFDKMMNGFQTKEDIRKDWEKFLGSETSEFATGAERIFYWLFSQFGVPNSSPIGSDMFFETYNAFVHIDIKTVTLSNIGDTTKTIFIGDNQTSYIGRIPVNHKSGIEYRNYHGNLPTFYTKKNGTKKVCLTYFLTILYDETNLNIKVIYLSCMPNGELGPIYGDRVLTPGKNPGKVRFNFSDVPKFELLIEEPLRTKILYWNDQIDAEHKIRLKTLSGFKDTETITFS